MEQDFFLPPISHLISVNGAHAWEQGHGLVFFIYLLEFFSAYYDFNVIIRNLKKYVFRLLR